MKKEIIFIDEDTLTPEEWEAIDDATRLLMFLRKKDWNGERNGAVRAAVLRTTELPRPTTEAATPSGFRWFP